LTPAFSFTGNTDKYQSIEQGNPSSSCFEADFALILNKNAKKWVKVVESG